MSRPSLRGAWHPGFLATFCIRLLDHPSIESRSERIAARNSAERKPHGSLLGVHADRHERLPQATYAQHFMNAVHDR